MTSDQLWVGVRAGVVGAAATVGAVATLAARAGDVLRPFAATGTALAARAAPPAAALVGVAAYLALGIACGVLLAAVAPRGRGGRLVLAACAVSLLAFLATDALVPALRLGFGLGVFPLRGAPLVYLHALLAAALALGMRIAR